MIGIRLIPGTACRLLSGVCGIVTVITGSGCQPPPPSLRVNLSSWPQIVSSVTKERGFRMGQEGDETYLGRGWAGLEQDPDGRFFRWALGDTVELRIPIVDVRDRLLRLRWAPPPTSSGEQQGVAFLVNGVEVMRRSITSRRYHWFDAPLPARALRRGWNNIVIVPSLRTPPEIDSRPLRFAVRDVLWDTTHIEASRPDVTDREWIETPSATGIRVLAPGQALSFTAAVPKGSSVSMTYQVMGSRAGLRLSGEPVVGGDELLWSGTVEKEQRPVTIQEDARRDFRTISITVDGDSQSSVAISSLAVDLPSLRGEGRLFVLVTVDGLRWDSSTRSHDGLRGLLGRDEERVSFLQAYTPSPAALPGYCSVMTSMYPFVHGVLQENGQGLSDAAPTIASLLGANGYRCAAVVADPALSPRRSRLGKGFDFFSSPDGTLTRSAGEVADDAVRYVFQAWNRLTPGFLWLQCVDPAMAAIDIEPGAPPPGMEAYERSVARVDSCIGFVRLCLEQLGFGSRMVVVVTAVRGAQLAAVDGQRLFPPLAQPLIHVPLTVHVPGQDPPSRSVVYPVSLLDIMPTLLELGDVATPAELHGSSLLPRLRGQEAWPTVFSEAIGGIAFSAVRPPFKVISAMDTENPPPSLPGSMLMFDLASDPGESLSVLASNVSRATDLVGEWQGLIGQTITRYRPVKTD